MALNQRLADAFLVLVLGLPFLASADQDPYLDSTFKVPAEYQAKYASAADHAPDDAPVKRYSDTYEAFWWNCVAVKAANLDDRCPFMASGWPAEGAGASDGATRAVNDISELVKKYGPAKVQAYLRELASPAILKAKLAGRFTKPTADPHGL